ncbi:hypothetical protein N7445_004866 [Penicillium cf. griseofulvum]|nr:hypothetical protein N7445_004866 [Penicillium cf. griseofulvum]
MPSLLFLLAQHQHQPHITDARRPRPVPMDDPWSNPKTRPGISVQPRLRYDPLCLRSSSNVG